MLGFFSMSKDREPGGGTRGMTGKRCWMTVVELQQVMQRRVNRDLGKIFPNCSGAHLGDQLQNFFNISHYALRSLQTWSSVYME